MPREITPEIAEENASEVRAGSVDWTWAVVSRPAVIDSAAGMVDGTLSALLDGVIAASRDAIVRATGRAAAIEAAPQDNATAPAHSYGVALALRGRPLHTLIMLDSPAIRALATALTLDAGMAAPNSPAPVAEPADSDKGLVEFLSLAVLDHVLKAFGTVTGQPVIESFCDKQHAELWQQKHSARHLTLRLTMLGVEGLIRIWLAGVDEGQWSAITAGMSNVGRTPVDPAAVQVRLGLPPVPLQMEEYAKLAAGDVILLGGPDLLALPLPGELVTDTHWSLGSATITHDTPTYLTVTWTPRAIEKKAGTAAGPAVRAGAVTGPPGTMLVQPVLGRASVAVAALRAAKQPVSLHLTKETAAPVLLMVGARRTAVGELVVLGSELGVRIMRMEGT